MAYSALHWILSLVSKHGTTSLEDNSGHLNLTFVWNHLLQESLFWSINYRGRKGIYIWWCQCLLTSGVIWGKVHERMRRPLTTPSVLLCTPVSPIIAHRSHLKLICGAPDVHHAETFRFICQINLQTTTEYGCSRLLNCIIVH